MIQVKRGDVRYRVKVTKKGNKDYRITMRGRSRKNKKRSWKWWYTEVYKVDNKRHFLNKRYLRDLLIFRKEFSLFVEETV